MKLDDVISNVLPQFFPAGWLEPPGMVFSDFPSRIRIGYLLRSEESYEYLCDESFAALAISLEELHSAALVNLARLPDAEISIGRVPEGAEGWISVRDDNFTAVRILLPTVQEMFSREMGDQFLVSVAHRDDCFCWSLSQSTERQEKHIHDALAAFLNEPYNLTPDILLCSQGRFQLYREQTVDFEA